MTKDSKISKYSVERLARAVNLRAPVDGYRILRDLDDASIADVLGRVNFRVASRIVQFFDPQRKVAISSLLPDELGAQWEHNMHYPRYTVGRIMEPAPARLALGITISSAIDQLRETIKKHLFSYGYVVDDDGKLLGVLVMRDLLLSENHEQLIDEIMLEEPYWLEADMTVSDAVVEAGPRQYPAYPVCDFDGRLLGLIQGSELFEQRNQEIASQPSAMLGVSAPEYLETSWKQAFFQRHKWLQINLITAFVAAAVVGVFEETISQLVALAVFLPVLAGQSGNTGGQALAVTLRGLVLNHYKDGMATQLLRKEALLGLVNGVTVGLVAGVAMFLYASHGGAAEPLRMALTVVLAMTFSCVASGISGVLVPLGLRKIGTDPATASAIILTTATDVASMGAFLGLAALLI